jgi:hypothetical protein
VEGIREPVGRPLATALRRAVLDHVLSERRRHFPTLVHVGTPGGAEEVFAVDPDDRLDHALRADVLAALLQRARHHGSLPVCWLTRPGPLDMQDVDAQWLAAARTAGAEAGVGVTLVVVTRRGWRDPRSGVRREWKRLRERGGA